MVTPHRNAWCSSRGGGSSRSHEKLTHSDSREPAKTRGSAASQAKRDVKVDRKSTTQASGIGNGRQKRSHRTKLNDKVWLCALWLVDCAVHVRTRDARSSGHRSAGARTKLGEAKLGPVAGSAFRCAVRPSDCAARLQSARIAFLSMAFAASAPQNQGSKLPAGFVLRLFRVLVSSATS